MSARTRLNLMTKRADNLHGTVSFEKLIMTLSVQKLIDRRISNATITFSMTLEVRVSVPDRSPFYTTFCLHPPLPFAVINNLIDFSKKPLVNPITMWMNEKCPKTARAEYFAKRYTISA
jgi:hypothetical protein